MASDVVIRAEGLGKKYIIGHQAERERYTALRDVMARSVRNFARGVRDLARGQALIGGDSLEEFWALRDLDFEIRRGEVVGVIGRNGAGKSTLLKVLSRITEPSEGRVEIRGRVASLLEVGTGFHPELTGRENIFLNGAILGMSRAEIRRKFDEIVAFAEVERFLDTPVKRYSSGMYVRLAFAVAAHLEPEILVVDEVLAVGDAEFQKKCLGKMSEVAGHGRTVLFVSHNMAAVGALCETGLLLDKGRAVERGPVEEVLLRYGAAAAAGGQFERTAPAGSIAALTAARAEYDPVGIRVNLDLTILAREAVSVSIDLRVTDAVGAAVGFASLGALDQRRKVSLSPGANRLKLSLGAKSLASGAYLLGIDITDPNVAFHDRVDQCLSFSVEPIGSDQGARPMLQSWGYGSVVLDLGLVEHAGATP